MKIIMLGHINSETSDATSIHFSETANAYSRLGHLVSVICPQVTRDIYDTEIDIKDYPVKYEESLKSAFLHSFFIYKKLFRVITPDTDLVHIRWRLFPAIIVRLICWLKGCFPHILAEHNGWLDLEIKIQRNSKLIAWIGKALQISDSMTADQTLTVTDGIRNLLIDSGILPDKIFTVGNGTNVSHFYPLENKSDLKQSLLGVDGTIIGFIGNISKWQGIDDIVDSFANINRNFNNVYLLIAGSGMYKEELEKKIRQTDYADKIILKPNIPYDKVNEWMNVIDIAVAPKTKKLNIVGYSPLKIRDYAAAGCAVVSTDVNGIVELEEHGWLKTYNPENPESLEILLSNMLLNNIHEEMGRKARKFAEEHFSWNKIAEAIIGNLPEKVTNFKKK